MDQKHISEAAELFVEARRTGKLIESLPVACRPQTLADAHAIQDATVAALGEAIDGWKVGAETDGVVMRGAILHPRVFDSPARVAAAAMPMRGAEPEIAFQFDRDLPPRNAAYSRSEIKDAVTAFVAIEIVDTRFANFADAPPLERAADIMSSGGFVRGTRNEGWRDVDLVNLVVSVSIDGEVVVQKSGGHPATDPLLPAIELVNQLRHEAGVKAGQFMTTGSYAGLHIANPGQTVTAAFQDFGTAEVTFTA